MFPLAILIGVYSYLIFVLGVSHLLYPLSVFVVSILWVLGVVLWFKKDILKFRVLFDPPAGGENFSLRSKNIATASIFLIFILVLIWSVNLFGVFAPERAFDALWYHLTLPKIFIENHAIFYIPGGLFYYSLMPKLVDLLFIPALMIGGTVAAKLVHFIFGILTLIVIYKISRYFLPLAASILVLVVFSSNLVVAWEATTAYIDLGRTFFEAMAFYGILLFITEKKRLWLTESAIMLGFATSTKLLAVASLPILLGVLMYLFRDRIKEGFKESVKFSITALAVPLPYFIFSFINTGNPVYPLFTEFYTTEFDRSILSPIKFAGDIFMLFVKGEDPVSPIYLIVIPLILFIYRKFRNLDRLVLVYSFLSLLIWYFTPRTGGGRFILPYLPLLSLIVGIIIHHTKNKAIQTMVTVIIIFLASTTIIYRSIASYKYVPVIFGSITQSDFLTQNLRFDNGDFYDTDGYLSKTIDSQDTVLIYGVHNLYYVNFPFVHASYIKKGDEFNYILAPTKDRLPERFYMWNEIYTNPDTGISLYSQRGNIWVY